MRTTKQTIGGALAALGIAAAAAPAAGAAPLKRFANCAALTSYTHARATALTGANGYGAYPIASRTAPVAVRSPVVGVPATVPVPTAEAGTGGVPVAAPSSAATPATSGTNVQEQGVDEPDVVLADAGHIYTTVNEELRIYTAADTPVEVGRLALGGIGTDAQLLRVGDRIMVFSTLWRMPLDVETGAVRISGFAPTQAQTMVRLVDVADPRRPRLLETLRYDGTLLAVRRPTGGAVRVVISTAPDPIPFVLPAGDNLGAAQARARNRAAVRRTTARTWLPAMTVRRAGAPKPRAQIALRCRAVARTAQFGGLATLTVLTVDPARGLTPLDRDAILSDGHVVYASGRSLFVTTPRWFDRSVVDPARVSDRASTEIHRFDISRPTATTYAASGRVPGYLLNQFSLSEWNGVLRVASTHDPEWVNAASSTPSSSSVTNLWDDGSSLVQVGQVNGLGTDERIYGVRFIADRGYVVTFRQVDPLHVLDLADPRAPKLRGELVIPGYSSYLHPAGDGLLIGVGQNATTGGQLKGTQISLFDVSNADAPRRLHSVTLANAWSAAESDHHAFLHWAPTGLTMIPATTFDAAGVTTTGAGYTVLRTGISALGSVAHPANEQRIPGEVRRSLVIGDRVFTLSNVGLGANRLSDLGTVAYTSFGKLDTVARTGVDPFSLTPGG